MASFTKRDFKNDAGFLKFECDNERPDPDFVTPISRFRALHLSDREFSFKLADAKLVQRELVGTKTGFELAARVFVDPGAQ